MDRRSFLGGLAGSLLAAPLAAEAQQAGKVYRIGLLSPGSASTWAQPAVQAFRRGLGELGWVEGRNIVIEARWAEDKLDRLPALAVELVGLRLEVIVAITTSASVAVKRATSSIPIVMSGIGDPVASGLVQSLARPGGNVTGLTSQPGSGFTQKMVQLLKEAAPRVSRLAVLWNSTDPGSVSVLGEIQAAAPALGLTVVNAEARESKEVATALAAVVREQANGLYIAPSSLHLSQRTLIADFAVTNRLPSMFGDARNVAAGGLMSYWTNWLAIRRRTAFFVDKILKGAKPADLPVEEPTKFELVINLKTAKALGLTIPPSLLQRADQVIE
jgi:putative ABC transport system substrate-binding protein